MDTLRLDYKLKTCGIDRKTLLDIMGWSESTRQARCIRGENWLVDEVNNLIQLGMTRDDVFSIFFGQLGNKSDHKSGQNGGAEND